MLRWILPIVFMTATALAEEPMRVLDLSKYALRSVYENEFTAAQKIVREEEFCAAGPDGVWKRKALPPADAEWVVEGAGGVMIRDGRLWVAPSPYDAQGVPKVVPEAERSHLVVWNRQVFPENFLFEVEMDPTDSKSGLTIAFFCATGAHGEDIFDLDLPPRRADYKAYHSGALANYSESYWSRNTEVEGATNRLRKNPGFKLVAEGSSLTAAGSPGPYRLRVFKYGAHLEVELNAQIIFRWDDPDKPLGAGRIGLRSMAGVTQVAYSHFKVWEVTPKAN